MEHPTKKYYRCPVCGNLLEAVSDSGVTPVCCGRPMEILEPGTSDGAVEKHVPKCSREDRYVKVHVGEEPHPMLNEHYIQWIALETNRGYYRRCLSPGRRPEVCFCMGKGEEPIAVYEYCNLHGLWVTKF